MSWPSVSIGDLVQIRGGGTPRRDNEAFFKGDIPWVTPKDMKSWRINNSQIRITREAVEQSATRMIDVDSVLVVVRSGILKHSLPVAINTVPVAINQDMKALSCRPGLDPGYLARQIKASEDKVLSWVRATTADNFPVEKLKELEIPLPPLSDQRRIAAILDQADALRAKRRAALARLDEMGRAIFDEMFGGPATLNRWPTVQLGGVLSIPLRNGVSPSSEGTLPLEVLTLSAVTGKTFDGSARKPGLFQNRVPMDKRVNALDLLICRGNGNRELVGRGFLPTTDLSDVVFPDTMIAARVSPEAMVPRFLETIWNAPFVREQIKTRARTTNGTFKVNQQALEEVRLPAPPMALQQSFASRSGAVLESSHLGRRHLGHLDALFASLQHRAFRGEL